MHRWVLAFGLCAARAASAQGAGVLHGKTVDSAGVGVASVITVRTVADSASEIAHTVTAADGSFHVTLPTLPARLQIDVTGGSGLSGRLQIDSLAVRASAERPVVIRLGGAHVMQTVQVRAQRRPSVFGFFEGEASTRVEPAGLAAMDWLDPFSIGGLDPLLRASPDLLITSDGGSSLLGAPSSSNQLQIGGVRVPSGLISGQLNGNLSLSPWDPTIGGAAGATVNLFLAPASRYRSSYALLRSGIGIAGRSTVSPEPGGGVNVPAQVTGSATGPLGKLGFRANVFLATEARSSSRWGETLDTRQRPVLDSVSAVLGVPTFTTHERRLQGGILGRLDLLPFDNKRVLALTSALTRSMQNGASGNGLMTASAAADIVDDVGFLQLESARVVRERVLWSSILNTSWARNEIRPVVVAPTVIATDATTGSVFVMGGAVPQATDDLFAVEARSTATWYSASNRARYIAQLQVRVERGRIGATPPHDIFTTNSIDALANGHAVTLLHDEGAAQSAATSEVMAPAVSGRFDLRNSGSLLLGIRADAWSTNGVASGSALHYADLSPRISLLQRIGERSGKRGPIATLRVGAGRFTDWPSVQQWSDAWTKGGGGRELCAGANVPPIVLATQTASCASSGAIQALGQPMAGGDLRPTAADRADVSISIAEIAPGLRAEFGAALAQTERITVRLSALSNLSVVDRLSGESGRALLVPVGSIGTDGIVPVVAIPPGFPNATRLISDGRTAAAQWRVRVATLNPFANVKLAGAYTLTTGHERSLAIASPLTAPTLVSGPLSAGGRHTFAFSAGTWIGDTEIRFAGMARSGVRFTPLADRDLNGDGSANDAAFVPASEAEAWASSVAPGVRSCILKASGRIARVNSCTGPWSISSLFLASIPGTALGMRSGASLELQVSNPFAAVIRSNRVTFGDLATVDPFLVHITGFDATQQRFGGGPLKRFGTNAGVPAAVASPVRIALSIRIPLGPSVTAQRASSALRALKRDTSARAIRGAALEYLSDLPPLPLVVLQAGEGVQLTASQRSALQVLAGRWQAAAIEVVGDALTEDPLTASSTSRRERLIRARATFLTEMSAIASEIRQVLSADQIDLLPDGVQRLLDPRFLHFLAGQDAATY